MTFSIKMKLSRGFCQLMCKIGGLKGNSDFEQVAKLANVDINPILSMQKYWDEESVNDSIARGKTDEDKKRIANGIKADNDRLSSNIDIVYKTLTHLEDRLSIIDNLEKKIDANGYDPIGIEYYFSDFNIDKGDGYIGNNFGRDLRNFKRFLEYAKSKGTSTVFFHYG